MTAPLRTASTGPRDSDDHRRPRPSRPLLLLTAAVALGCLGVALLVVDLPVAQWCKVRRLPRELARILDFAEVFAHGTGAAILLVVALVLDPALAWPSFRWPALRWPSYQPLPSQRNFARMVGATFTGGLVVDCIKAVVERVRPRAADLISQGSALATFGNAALATPTGSHSDLNSFPSGHAAVAAGLAAALAWKYPHGVLLFVVLAACASAQRITTSAHFPSDVAVGSAIGLLGAAIFLWTHAPERPSTESAASRR
jgi:membrane-associated phospholipid phosphatase